VYKFLIGTRTVHVGVVRKSITGNDSVSRRRNITVKPTLVLFIHHNFYVIWISHNILSECGIWWCTAVASQSWRGAPGYGAPPNGCCAPVTVSPNYEKMALYIVHSDGAPLKSHGAPHVLTTWWRAWAVGNSASPDRSIAAFVHNNACSRSHALVFIVPTWNRFLAKRRSKAELFAVTATCCLSRKLFTRRSSHVQ